MPGNVLLFERLMYVSLLIGLLIFGLDGDRVANKPEIQDLGGAKFVLSVLVASLALFVLFIWLIARKGKNWARWVFAGLFAIGLINTYQNIADLIQHNGLAAILSVAQVVIQVFAVYLLFSPEARPWFENKAAT